MNAIHHQSTYWSEGQGKYVLPLGVEWTQVVYDHGTGPQTTTIARFLGETDQEAGDAWAQEAAILWGYPVNVILCSDDDDAVEIARSHRLLGLLSAA